MNENFPVVESCVSGFLHSLQKTKVSEYSSILNNNHDYHLVFNQKPLGYYPLVYENGHRQPVSELEIMDLALKQNLYVNKNQNNWFGVEGIPN